MFPTIAAEKIKTGILGSVAFFPPKIMPFMRYFVKKYSRVGQATDDKII